MPRRDLETFMLLSTTAAASLEMPLPANGQRSPSASGGHDRQAGPRLQRQCRWARGSGRVMPGGGVQCTRSRPSGTPGSASKRQAKCFTSQRGSRTAGGTSAASLHMSRARPGLPGECSSSSTSSDETLSPLLLLLAVGLSLSTPSSSSPAEEAPSPWLGLRGGPSFSDSRLCRPRRCPTPSPCGWPPGAAQAFSSSCCAPWLWNVTAPSSRVSRSCRTVRFICRRSPAGFGVRRSARSTSMYLKGLVLLGGSRMASLSSSAQIISSRLGLPSSLPIRFASSRALVGSASSSALPLRIIASSSLRKRALPPAFCAASARASRRAAAMRSLGSISASTRMQQSWSSLMASPERSWSSQRSSTCRRSCTACASRSRCSFFA
mmetsp:Transcript_39068/g.101817  ORF Transcript_39068/g.101817 Transcript_39068/m.101817 type:complete len:379 (-) Transcript_39068:57-1193(-)